MKAWELSVSFRPVSADSPELSFVTNGSILALLLLLIGLDLQFAGLIILMRPRTRKSTKSSQNSKMVKAENPMYNAKMPPKSDNSLSIWKNKIVHQWISSKTCSDVSNNFQCFSKELMGMEISAFLNTNTILSQAIESHFWDSSFLKCRQVLCPFSDQCPAICGTTD